MFTLGKIKRLAALSLFAVFTVFRASATLTLSSDVTTSCPGEAIVLTCDRTSEHYGHWFGYKYSYDGTNWEYCQSMTHLNRIATDMPDDGDVTVVYYKVIDEETNPRQESPVIKVTKNTSLTCNRTCHTTTNGDYFLGTDFNPLDGSSTATIPNGVISYFADNNITFNKGGVGDNYTITANLQSVFGSNAHIDDSLNTSGSNYYYVVKNPNASVVQLSFDPNYVLGHTYRYTMRMYIQFDPSCGQSLWNAWSNASFMARTGFGNQTVDYLEGIAYNDATGAVMTPGDTAVLRKNGGDVARVMLRDLIDLSSVSTNSSGKYDIIRLDITYYGTFPNSSNGLTAFNFTPYFEQLSCGTVAIDYISAEVESICMDKGSNCLGSYKTVNAAGFPRNAIYTWQHYNKSTKEWSNVVIGGIEQVGTQFSRISIPITYVGKDSFRVYDANPICSSTYDWQSGSNVTTCDTVMVAFNVTGKDCDGTPPESIDGDTVICAPSSALGDTMTVIPIDVNPGASYHWTLTDPDGNEVTDKSIIYQEVTNTRGTQIILRLPATAKEGDYTLSCYMTKTEDGYTQAVGSTVSKVIHVYSTPTAHFTVDGFKNDGKDSICASDNYQQLFAVDNSKLNNKYEYIYTWRNAKGFNLSGDTALITWDQATHDSLCAGTKGKHQIWESVELKGIGCKATWDTILSVKTPLDPVIDCDELGAPKQIKYLTASQSKMTITLPAPSISGSCDRYPTVHVVGGGTDAAGNDLSFQIIARLDSLQNGLVPAMTRTIGATAGKDSENGLIVTYYAYDGCGKQSNTCNVKYIIRDTIGPDIPCSDIPNYETKLSYYNVDETDGVDTCYAYPGQGSRPDLLPTLTNPVLTDQNGVDGKIKGEYIGRLDNQMSTPSASEALFKNNKTKLNDSIPAGYSYILWKFSDAVGNASYCIQKITVTDDKKPSIDCPEDTKGNISVQDATTDCGLSLDSLLAKLSTSQIPTAADVCPSRSAIINARYFYRQVPATAWTEITDKSALTFKLGNTYELAWRFYKQGTGSTVDKTVYAECIRTFTVVDSIPPVTDCSLLNDTAVTVNSSKDALHEDLAYASATDTRTYSYITYTLDGFFKSIPTAKDACSGELKPVVSITTPDGKTTTVGKATDAAATVIKALNLFHFPVGLSSIEYVYTDEAGNVSSCEQNIVVYENIAMDCDNSLTLYADKDCIGHYDITAAAVKKAVVSYVTDYRLKAYQAGYSFWGMTFPDADYVAVTQDDNTVQNTFMGNVITEYGFNGLTALSDSSKSNLVSVFPYRVKKVSDVDANGKETAASVTTIIDNKSAKENFAKDVVLHRWYQSLRMDGTVEKKNVANFTKEQIQAYKNISLQTKTFDKEFTDEFKTFSKGFHKLVWYYENGQGDEDSCVVSVSVVDTTSPSVECGEWGKDLVRASDPKTCQATVNLTAPTASDLNASDNCSAAEKLTISYQRTFNGTTSTNMSAPYEQGTSLVTWTIADEDGNKAYCKQNITVNDSTGPEVDCDKVLVNPITVDADANCEAQKEVLVDAGLRIPVLDPSAELCSPTKEAIRGVGYRESASGVKDGLDVMNDPYPLGKTYVVWTFSDSLGNATVCRQLIVVNDNTAPVIDCDEFENNPLKYELASDQCSATVDQIKVLLGSHKAKDNCDADSIVGVPYMLLKNGTSRAELPDVFVKDTTYIIAWVFTDEAGNEAVCNQKVSIVDTTPPNNNICPDPERTLDAKVNCTFTYDELDIPNLQINDLCDGILVGKLTGEIQQPQGKTVYPSSDKEFQELQYYAGTVNKFKWTFTDHAGLTSTCEMTLTINDSIPPVINNCNTGNDATYEMSEGVCYAKWNDLKKLIVIPIAYDECQELIDGTGSVPLDPTEIRRYFNDSLVAVSTGSDTAWRADPFPRGITRLVWVFTDRSGNVDSCAKTFHVIVRTDPSFICDSIKPNPMRPVAEEGTCSVFFKDLEFGTYYGFNACTGDSILAKLLMAPVPDALPVPTDLEFKVGDTISVYWVVTDEDGNYSYCPQTVIPSHSNPINFDCSTLDTLKAKALEGECYVPADSINLPSPFAIDSCAQANGAKPDSIFGVPTRSDGLALKDNYPTGKTTISWMFVSPFNLNDTLICNQIVSVAGNKHFDLNCEEILPTVHDTIDGCEPDGNIDMTAPKVADPCIADTMITGVAIARSDSAAIADPFNLGTTIVTWTFTDATGSITDTCHQTIFVLTNADLEKPCDTAAMKTIEIPAPEDACTVPASDVELETPYALHPCTKDTVWGVLSRPGISDLNAPYNIGLNRLIWTFTDTTGTLAKPVDTCQQFVKVGSVDVEPVDCKNMPDVNKVLAEGNCTIDFSDFGLEIPAVIDRCPNGDPNADPVEILPTITRASKKGWSTTKVSEIGTFGVGRDTIFWDYTIAGVEYHCEQHIGIKDSVEPNFDCSKLQPIQAEAEEGKCEVDSSVVLSLLRPFPVATESCTGDSIVGVPTLEDGSALPATFKVGDTVIIKWTFIDTLVNVKAKTCTQPVTVISNAEPIFDCNSLDTLKFVAKGSCSIDITEDMIPVPVAKDSCTGTDVPGVASRADGGAVYGTYNTGFVTLTWTFDSPYSTKNKVCQQTVWVVTDLEIDAKCGKENYPDINVAVADGVCQVPASEVTPKLREHTAVNPCHSSWSIKGVPSRSDGLSLDDDYPVGTTTITWTFTDTTKTLLNPTSSCDQLVIVGDNNEPPVDCETSFPAAYIYLDDENCNADFTKVPVYLDHMPVNACNGDVAVLDTARESGKLMTDPFEVGKDVIIWTFTFPTNKQKVVCRQNVEVFDTIAPKFDCNTLEPVITVAFSKAGIDYVTYDEVVAAGFYIPTVTDKCCEVKTSVTRNDGKNLEDNYELGETTITFVFSDDHGNDKICSQIIKVTDMIPPTEECPHFGGNYTCLSDIPAELSYDELIAAGGSIDFPDRVDVSTFKAVDKIIGDSCEAMVLRDYTFQSIRQDNIGCANGPDTFYVKDNIAPEYVGINPAGESITTGCDNVSYNVPTVTASDNCDPNPKVSMNMVSTQGDDPSQCSAYTYDITYTFAAVDRCGNEANPVTFTVHVKDTMPPIIHTPANWDDVMYPVYLKHCKFGVPDITGLIPLDSVELACGDKQYIKVWQNPAAGDTIDTTTIVALHFMDVCGNDTVLYKTVAIQPVKEIIDIQIIHDPYLTCGTDESWLNPRAAKNSITNTEIKQIFGKVKVEDWDGSWGDEITNAVVDYYRDSVSFENLIYSSPGAPYSYLYKNTEPKTEAGNLAFGNCVLLTRRSQSGTYFFVATDTVTGCTDTASTYIDVRERPRIALESGEWNLCEGDSLTLQGDFGDAFVTCVEEMGAVVTAEGWMVNDSIYNPLDSVNYDEGIDHKAYYYATNECGTTTSLNTLYTSCSGDLPSAADSLAFAGSAEKLAEMVNDSLYLTDSVKLNVFTHFDPAQVLLSTDPQDKARIWAGDEADLVVTMPYDEPSVYRWMEVVGDFDGERNAVYNNAGNVVAGGSNENDDEELLYVWNTDDSMYYSVKNTFTVAPLDSTYYYVLVGNGVCPTVPSNLVSIDVLDKLPTAITPYTKDGMNDDFVRGHHVIIFNRYGQQVFEGNDGWDGTYRGLLADPGVYFYEVDMAGGIKYKGSVEVVKIK